MQRQQPGALVTSAAAILNYYQSLGIVPQPNGLADPLALNQFLNCFARPILRGAKCGPLVPGGAAGG